MRPLTYLRAAFGAVLLLAPGALLRDLPHARIDARARLFARVLGARHLVEAVVLGTHPRRPWLLAGAVVDGLHSSTMVALAVADPARRELATVNAAIAAALAADGVHAARRAP